MNFLNKIILAGGGKSVVYLKYIKNYFILLLWYFHSHVSDFVFPFMSIKIFQIEHHDLNFFNNLIKEGTGLCKGTPLVKQTGIDYVGIYE